MFLLHTDNSSVLFTLWQYISSGKCMSNLTTYVIRTIEQVLYFILVAQGFPGDSDGKASACNAGDLGLIPGLGSSPGEGNGNPLQYSCLEKSMDGGAWQATVHGIAKSQT